MVSISAATAGNEETSCGDSQHQPGLPARHSDQPRRRLRARRASASSGSTDDERQGCAPMCWWQWAQPCLWTWPTGCTVTRAQCMSWPPPPMRARMMTPWPIPMQRRSKSLRIEPANCPPQGGAKRGMMSVPDTEQQKDGVVLLCGIRAALLLRTNASADALPPPIEHHF